MCWILQTNPRNKEIKRGTKEYTKSGQPNREKAPPRFRVTSPGNKDKFHTQITSLWKVMAGIRRTTMMAEVESNKWVRVRELTPFQ